MKKIESATQKAKKALSKAEVISDIVNMLSNLNDEYQTKYEHYYKSITEALENGDIAKAEDAWQYNVTQEWQTKIDILGDILDNLFK